MNSKLVSAALAAMLVVACRRGGETSTTTTTGADVMANDTAVLQLTNARCDREVACNDVGAGQKFADRDACMRELKYQAEASIRADACPNGVLTRNVSKCIESIRNERCGTSIDTLDRVSSCRRSELCKSR